MQKPKTIECMECDAVFDVKHEMSETHYTPQYCVFCGEHLEIELSLPIADEFDEFDDNSIDLEQEW